MADRSPDGASGDPAAGGAAGPIVCHCFRLTCAGLRHLLETHHCRTVEDVAERTGACRGCQTCRPDIERILKERAT